MECPMASVTDGTDKKKLNSKTAEDVKSKKEEPTLKSKSSIKVKGNKALKLLESQGYIVGRTLGSGSYACVKSAYDIKRKHKVAIKIIKKKKSFEEYLTKFLPREMEAMRALGQHYALIRFFQIIETTSRHFFVMELADNGDLLTEIKTKDYIKEDQAGQWFKHLYDGIKFMHSKGLVHRDIKCENLVLNAENTLKITDFGFAKKIGKSKNGGPQLSETFCGSYAYAPPEILKGIPYNPENADIWSMGVVLFTMVYGRLPFDDSDHKKLIKQVQSRIAFPAKPEISEKCRVLILKILSKVPDRILLKQFKTDAWFKLHKAPKKIENAEECENEVADTDDTEADVNKQVEKGSGKASVLDERSNGNDGKDDTNVGSFQNTPENVTLNCVKMTGCTEKGEEKAKDTFSKQEQKTSCLPILDVKSFSEKV